MSKIANTAFAPVLRDGEMLVLVSDGLGRAGALQLSGIFESLAVALKEMRPGMAKRCSLLQEKLSVLARRQRPLLGNNIVFYRTAKLISDLIKLSEREQSVATVLATVEWQSVVGCLIFLSAAADLGNVCLDLSTPTDRDAVHSDFAPTSRMGSIDYQIRQQNWPGQTIH